MTRSERLLLIAFFVAVLALLAWAEPTATALGTAGGVVAGVAVGARLRSVSTRVDARIGPDETAPATGFALRRPLLSAGAHLAILGGLLLVTFFVPFVGDELYAVTAGGVTALAAVVTAGRLRR